MTSRKGKPPRHKGPQRRPERDQAQPTAGPKPDASTGRAVRQTTAYLRNLFEEVGFSIDARKGQNFLVDLNLLDLLERSAEIEPDDIVLEVGSGTAALTERLARAAFRVVSAEIDRRLATLARDRLIDAENVTIVEGDVLASKHRLAPAVLAAIDEAEAARQAAGRSGRFLLVANLPYCVATPVISNLLLVRPFASATVTVQREMGERMIAAAGSHAYNALSVWSGPSVAARSCGFCLRLPSGHVPRSTQPSCDSNLSQNAETVSPTCRASMSLFVTSSVTVARCCGVSWSVWLVASSSLRLWQRWSGSMKRSASSVQFGLRKFPQTPSSGFMNALPPTRARRASSFAFMQDASLVHCWPEHRCRNWWHAFKL